MKEQVPNEDRCEIGETLEGCLTRSSEVTSDAHGTVKGSTLRVKKDAIWKRILRELRQYY